MALDEKRKTQENLCGYFRRPKGEETVDGYLQDRKKRNCNDKYWE